MKSILKLALFSSLLLVITLNNLSNLSQAQVAPFTPQQCMMCRFVTNLSNYLLATQRGVDTVYKITNSYCAVAQIEPPEICSRVSKLFNRYITKVLRNGLFTPDQFCGLLSNDTCGEFKNPLSDWEINLNISATLDQEQLAKMRVIDEARRRPQKQYRIFHISDTHVDWKYEEGSISNCDQPLCCRAKSTRRKKNGIERAGYWGSLDKCDIPLRTFESALKFIAKTMGDSDDIPYIIWTGDIQPHDIWEQDKFTALINYAKVFTTIFRYLPKAKIFPTFGNHEMVPVDSFSPSNLKDIAQDDSPDWLYKEIDTYWSRWLPNNTVETIIRDGFYAVTVQPGLKIISLNTNFCHNKNFWLYINSTDPGNQLEWLIHELLVSELEHEKVHIIGHIPPGTTDCLKAWSKNFNKIVRRFSNTITGQFYGHTHQDEFEMLYDQDGSEKEKAVSKLWQPISTAFIGGSLTTFIGLNPSLRIYTIDPSRDYIPVDFETYYMDLAAANANMYKVPEWKSSGLFTTKFGIHDTSPQSLHELLLEMAQDLKMNNFQFPDASSLNKFIYRISSSSKPDVSVVPSSSKLFHLFYHSNKFSEVFGEDVFLKTSIEERKTFLCLYFTGQSHNHNACDQFI